MLILNVYMYGRRHQPTSWQETERLITAVVENLPDPAPRQTAQSEPQHVVDELQRVLEGLPQPNWPYGGEIAEFTLAERQHASEGDMPHFDSYLHVAVNARTGYGALKWMLTQGSTVLTDASIGDQVWLSDNPAPPDINPDVISDPGFPRYHHPRSTLPVALVRAAVEEFCRTDTGHRPTCIEWTPGDLAGRRLDTPAEEAEEDVITHCEDPWCTNSGQEHPAH
jgi:hypothetical protein